MQTKNETKDPAETKQDLPDHEGAVCQIQPGVSLRPGMICPRCHQSKIEYDGMLNLVCPNCGLTEAGACT